MAALVLDATLAEAHASLSSVYLRAGRPLEAERSARRALALDPDMAQAHQNLAHCWPSRASPRRPAAIAIAPMPGATSLSSRRPTR